MKVSVVTISYNCVGEIEPTLKSVVEQTFSDFEYIVIDGGSTDGTVDVINKYKDNISFFVSEPDNGIYDAMNKGLSHVKGEWVIFMNAGDSFVDNRVLEDIDFEQDCVGIYGNAIYVRKDYEELLVAKEPDYIRWRNMPTTHQAFFLKSKEAKSVGFNRSYKYDADYNMIYQVYKRNGFKGIKHIDRTICRYEAYNGTTMHHGKEIFGETLKIREEHTLRWFVDYLIWVKKCILEH